MTSYASALARARGRHGDQVHVVGRPKTGRVVHLYVGATTTAADGKIWVPGRHPRPVCGWRSLRLAVLTPEQSTTDLGFHVSGVPLCRRCAHVVEKWPEQPLIPLQLGPLDIALAAAAAEDLDELLACMDAAREAGVMSAHLNELIACAGQELLGGGHHGPALLPLGARLSNIAARMYEEEGIPA